MPKSGFQPSERTSESELERFVVGCSSPELGQGCSFSENGLNQNLSVVWLKFLKVVSDPKAMGTPDSA